MAGFSFEKKQEKRPNMKPTFLLISLTVSITATATIIFSEIIFFFDVSYPKILLNIRNLYFCPSFSAEIMRWGRRKPHNPSSFSTSSSSSSSSKPSFMSNILPASWFSKLKQKKSIPRKVKGTEKRNSPCIQSFDYANGNRGQLCIGDHNGEFWKLPFGDDDIDIKKSGGVLRSVWYNSENEHGLPRSSYRACRSKCTEFERKEKEDIQNLEDMVSRMTRRRRRRSRRETPTQVKISRRECAIESRTLKSKYIESGNFKNLGKKVVEKKGFKPERETDKAKERARRSLRKKMLKQEEDSEIRKNGRNGTKLTSSRKHRNVSSTKPRSFSLGTIEENHVLSSMKADESDELDIVGIEIDSKWERMKELKSRYERQRHPNENNPKGRRKIRVYSPRTGTKIEFCKIKALEDMKKAKLKMKKKVRDSTADDETDLESFAVVKSSFDPQQDFRDSMVEMIMERRISKAEELEQLLACYLTLNSDQYHDLIIKVFRQVWFDLNQASLESELHKQFSCNEQLL